MRLYWPFSLRRRFHGRLRGAARAALGFLALFAAEARASGGALLEPTSGTPPAGLQCNPALAADAGTVYAVWSDARDGGLDRLYWTHFAGDPPDSLASPLTASGAATEANAALAAGPGWALAAWESWEESGTRIVAAQVDAIGEPSPRPVSHVTTGAGPVHRPAVAVRGEMALALWEDEREKPGDLFFTRWRRDLGPADPGGSPLATGPGCRSWPRVASSPGGFLAVWSESNGASIHRVMALPFDAAGAPCESARAVSADLVSPTEADVVAVGTRYLVVWREPGSGGSDLAGRFADSDGLPLGGGAFTVSASAGFEYGPRLAASGVGACLIWFDASPSGRGLRRAFIDEVGGVHPAGGVALTDPADYVADAALAARQDGGLAAWRLPLPLDDDDVYAGVFTAGDTSGVPAPVPLTVSVETPLSVGGTAGGDRPPTASPNPFRYGVRIRRSPGRGSGVAHILDLAGRTVRRLPVGGDGASAYWDGRTEGGAAAPPGVYFVKFEGNFEGLRLVKLP